MFDPLGQYKTPEQLKQFSVVVHTPLQLKAALEPNLRGSFRILYQPMEGDVLTHWRHVGVMAYAIGDLKLGIDEIGLLCEGGQLAPDCTGDKPILYKLIHFGRHREVHIVATAQRPTDIALRYRSLSTQFRMFQVDEETEQIYLSKRIGKKTALLLSNLPQYAFVFWKDNGEVAIVQG